MLTNFQTAAALLQQEEEPNHLAVIIGEKYNSIRNISIRWVLMKSAVILEKKKQKYQENREAIKRKYEESKEAIERRYGENKEVVKQKYQENRKVILDRKKQKYQENKEAIKRKYEESREMNKRRKLELSWDDIKIQFQKMILEGMTERCYCCDRLWYASH